MTHLPKLLWGVVFHLRSYNFSLFTSLSLCAEHRQHPQPHKSWRQRSHCFSVLPCFRPLCSAQAVQRFTLFRPLCRLRQFSVLPRFSHSAMHRQQLQLASLAVQQQEQQTEEQQHNHTVFETPSMNFLCDVCRPQQQQQR